MKIIKARERRPQKSINCRLCKMSGPTGIDAPLSRSPGDPGQYHLVKSFCDMHQFPAGPISRGAHNRNVEGLPREFHFGELRDEVSWSLFAGSTSVGMTLNEAAAAFWNCSAGQEK